jgi:hypothetical protein
VRQRTAEYGAVPFGAVALGCVIAVLALANFVNGLFQDPAFPSSPTHQPFTPPATHPAAKLPTSSRDCADGRWRAYLGLTSEADCAALVGGRP